MTITQHHAALTQIATSTRQTEIASSRTDLLSTIGVSNVSNLAYPYGDYNASVQAMTVSAGYSAGRSVDPGYNYKNTDKYALKIQEVNRNTTIADIQNWVTTAKQNNTWLILMFHQIDDDTTKFMGATPDFLEDIVDYIGSADINVVTVDEGIVLMD